MNYVKKYRELHRAKKRAQREAYERKVQALAMESASVKRRRAGILVQNAHHPSH